jgi:hypothetical protein
MILLSPPSDYVTVSMAQAAMMTQAATINTSVRIAKPLAFPFVISGCVSVIDDKITT